MTRAAATIVLGLVASYAPAQPYDVSWSTVDNGGTMSATGGAFDLAGTVGQPDAGGPFAGGTFTLHGGFWAIAAAGGGGPQADLGITKTDSQTSAIPGQQVQYTIMASNAGPATVTGASVTDTPPLAITGVSWTCSASPGSACPTSGAGPINVGVNLLDGGSATFVMSGTIDPAATGSLVNTASLAPPAGVTDPVPLDNAATDTDALTPLADLALAIADAPDPVAPGAPLVYTLGVSNLGPSRSPGMTLTSTPDLGLVDFVSSSPGPPACTFAGALTCTLGALLPGDSATVTLSVRVKSVAPGTTIPAPTAVAGAAADPVQANNAAQALTLVQPLAPVTELLHGTRLERALPASAGLAGDRFRVRQEPYASYEVVVDAASADLGLGAGPGLELLAASGTVVQTSQPVGTGPARSLRFQNGSSTVIDDQQVLVRTLDLVNPPGPEDTYRVRAWDTTLRIPRFNNSSSQATILLLQNPTAEPVAASIFFWSPAGDLLATHTPAVPLPAKGLLVLSTAGVPGLAGTSGSITVIHDAPYGTVTGKAVAIEPATGFSFDSPLLPRPR